MMTLNALRYVIIGGVLFALSLMADLGLNFNFELPRWVGHALFVGGITLALYGAFLLIHGRAA